MQQTQRQLEITYENVNFNNYYKHKEMFTQLMTGLSFYSTIKKYSQINVDELIPAVYSYFYNSSYKDFQPRLNDKAKEEVVNFIQEIKNSKLNSKDQDLKEIDIEEIEKLSRLVNRTIEPLCIINAEIEIPTVRKYYKTAEGVSIKLVEERFKLINNLYWTISLYESFIAFDGIHQSERSTFLLNFTTYRSGIGLG